MGDCDPAWDAGGGLRLPGQHIFGKAFGVCGPTGIGNNLSGIFASHVSGDSGMSVASALGGYSFGFWSLLGGGVLLLLLAPVIQKLMHGVK